MTRATSAIDDCINKLKITKKNEPKREKRDTAEIILVQKSDPALAVLPDRRRRPCLHVFKHAKNVGILKFRGINGEGGGGLVSLLSPQVPVGRFFMKVSGLGLMGYETPYPEPRTPHLNPSQGRFGLGSFGPSRFGLGRFGLILG